MNKNTSFSVFILFLLSGFSALIYQVAWQRMLFTRLGGHIESVTIIVSIFMAGLGFGSLLGGELARRFPRRLLLIFGILELMTGIYGAFSITLMNILPYRYIFLSASLLLIIPTLMMGATLPLLSAGLAPVFQETGIAVSLLTFVNTLGSAAASLGAIFVLFRLSGLSGTVYFAAGVNILTGLYMLGREFIWGD